MIAKISSGTQHLSREHEHGCNTGVQRQTTPIHHLSPTQPQGKAVRVHFTVSSPHDARLILLGSSAHARALKFGPFLPLSGMSSGVEVPGSQRRPGIWSYFSFGGTRRRPLSVSLPRNFDPSRDADPFEKPDRHSRHRSTPSDGFMGDYKGSATMNQGQRLRYLKTGGVIAFILLVLYFVAPRDGLSKGVQTSRHPYTVTHNL